LHSFEEEGATIPQALLPLIPEDATRISDLISVVRQDGQWFYYCGTQPVFQHAEADLRSFRMFTAQLCVQRACKQAEIIKAFGVSKSSVLRSVNKYREEGIAGFYQPRRARGAPVMTPEVIQQAQQRFEEGHSKADVARELDIPYDTLRKAIDQGRVELPDLPADHDDGIAESPAPGPCRFYTSQKSASRWLSCPLSPESFASCVYHLKKRLPRTNWGRDTMEKAGS